VVSGQKKEVKLKTYKELVVWQKAMALVTEVYRISKGFPKEETYSLTSQIRRAAISVPSNIAEGSGRGTKELIRFLDIAYGSLLEMETQMEIAFRLEYLSENALQGMSEAINEIGRMLNGLRNSLENKNRGTNRPLTTEHRPLLEEV
jgi:four helix bundle protein